VLATFAKIGDRLEEAHRRVDYDEDAFVELSEAMVVRERLHRRFDLGTLARDLLCHPTTFAAFDDPFGQPPVTVYRGRSFFIDLIFWLESTTAIHQHGLTGTFQVIAGSSLHTTYRWKTRRTLNSRFEVGRTTRVESEHLQPGDFRRILRGDRFIHGLFHLDHPSVSMVVRTHYDDRARPPYTYHVPWFRFDPFHHDPGASTKRQLVAMLGAIGSPELGRALTTFGRGASFPDLYAMMDQLTPGTPEADTLMSIAEQRFPDLAPLAVETLSTNHRRRFIAGKRQAVRDRRQRFLLALLANLDTAEEIFARLRAWQPRREPRRLVLELVRELTTAPEGGSSLLGVEMTADMLAIFRAMLDGKRGRRLVAHLERKLSLSPDDIAGVEELEGQLRRSPLLGRLFAE
jgi:hypothetical protein